MNHDLILDALSGATGSIIIGAFAKHLPAWPITCQGVYDWLKGSIQEVASQRSGLPQMPPPNSTPVLVEIANPTLPVTPVEPQKE